jgi:hypothetical protein
MGHQLAGRAAANWAKLRPAGAAVALLSAMAAVPAVASVPIVASVAQAQVTSSSLGDPPLNIARTPAMDQACATSATLLCQQVVVQAIDTARAAEGVGPLQLPSYYDGLTVPEQLLVLTDLERVDRGLAGFVGLSSKLDVLAKAAASTNDDPNGPADATWGSNWAGGEASALLADYDWMYDDGPGSPNMDCTSAQADGCWDHRRNILGDYGLHPAIGTAATTVGGVSSMTELITSGPPGELDYSVPGAAVPKLVTPTSLVIGTTPRQPNSAVLTVRDGTGSFRASATVSGSKGDWSVTPLCTVAPHATCRLVVNFVPSQAGPARGTVTVNLPGGSEQVPVSAFIGHGYLEATSRGAIAAFGGGGYRGSAADLRLVKPVTGVAVTPDGGGYWEVAADGGVFSFGDAHFYGSAAELHARGPFVGMAVADGGRGYWLATQDGDIYSFGGAHFYGDAPGQRPDVVGVAATNDGRGYWMVTSKGAIYPFGDARYYGAAKPGALDNVVGMAVARDGHGYWMVTRNGLVLGFGDARYLGAPAARVAGAIVGMARPVDGPGYYLVAADGAVMAFGGAPEQASTRSTGPQSSVVAMATA